MKGGAMKEQEIIEVLRNENPSFKQLEEEHQDLEVRLAEFDGKGFLTPEEELEIKRIKKQKLIRKDRMAAFIREYKKGASMN